VTPQERSQLQQRLKAIIAYLADDKIEAGWQDYKKRLDAAIERHCK
jgi:hypothetical protein